MKAFITGATGLLGKALTARLLKEKHDVVTLVRDRIPGMYVDGAIIVSGDLQDLSLVSRVMAEYKIDHVFHLAAQSTVHTALADPTNTFDVNIRGTWNVLEACRRSAPTARVLVASSDKVYGGAACPYVESMPIAGLYPYDVSKSCADLLALSYAATYGIRSSSVRCSNLYGPGDLNWDRLIPRLMKFAYEGEEFTLRGGGTMKRDFLFVEDAVDGYLLAASDEKLVGNAINFGVGEPVLISRMAELALKLTGCKRVFPTVKPSPYETAAQWMNIGLARSKGWKPRHNLEEGLCKTVEWYRGWLT